VAHACTDELASCATGIKCAVGSGLCPSNCNNADCYPDYACAPDGTCKHKPGQTCGTDGECSTGECIDGVCCVGGCQRADDKCGSGCFTVTGLCKPFSPALTVCAPPTCNGTQLTTSTCDGMGACKRDTADCPVAGETCMGAGVCGP
jgi:hypothetical protein